MTLASATARAARIRIHLKSLCCANFTVKMVRRLSTGIRLNLSGKCRLETSYNIYNVARTLQPDTDPDFQHRHYHHNTYLNQFRTTVWTRFNQRCHPTSNILTTHLPFLQSTRPRIVMQYSNSQEGNAVQLHSVGDYYKLVVKEMDNLFGDIHQELSSSESQLRAMSQYYFNGRGKSFRPLVTLLMSKTCNVHNKVGDSVSDTQRMIAMVTEMIHTASLVHDDVIDASDTRRGQSSLNKLYGQRQAILVGDFILSHASIALAKTGNTQAISLISSAIEDLVSGEFMQLGSKENENERFSHYLKKTHKKTASLIANACKSVAVLARASKHLEEMAFQYGRNIGIAYQLIDDLLDFVSCEAVMGKPTSADLKLGLATAPVLFAAQEYPELHPMIMRRFTQDGDVEHACSLVAKSNGVGQTKLLASQHIKEAVRNMQDFTTSDAQQALIQLASVFLNRKN